MGSIAIFKGVSSSTGPENSPTKFGEVSSCPVSKCELRGLHEFRHGIFDSRGAPDFDLPRES